jgi:uncharacterized protein YkwD
MATLTCPRCKRPMAAPRGVCPRCRRELKPVSKPPPHPGWSVAKFLGVAAVAAVVGVLAVAGVVAVRSLFMPAPQPIAMQDEPEQSEPPAAPPKQDPPLSKPASEKKPVEKKPPPEPAPPDPKVAQALTQALLRQLNTYRKTAGLELVQLDTELSRGCVAHAKYVTLNAPRDAPGLLDEEPGKPGFSEEGRQAAHYAMVAVGDPRAAIEQWMARQVERVPLLKPDLLLVGLGVEPAGGEAWAVVLDVRHGGEPIVLYPAPGQPEVPLTFAGGPEVPDPRVTAGFPVTVTFPPARQVTQVRADLLDDAGQPVDVWVSTPEKPAVPNVPQGQHNTVALIAKGPLQASRPYRVRISASLDGEPWTKSWTFTTEDDADRRQVWAKKALAKVNDYRKLAGLEPVMLDADLSRGCLAHARYLMLNQGHPATLGLKAHDEDLTLPGASPEGRSAGRASDIAIGNDDPVHGIDAYLATLYHRVPLLEPNLQSVGYGCARARRQGWITVLNVASGRKPGRPHPVFFPAPDQGDVPLHFPIGGEEPNPIPEDRTGKAGYPVTATFPADAPLEAASLVLTDPGGKEVPAWLSSPETPANPKLPKHQGTTVCLIPKEPLQPGTVYRVHLRGKAGGKSWEKAWRFTTGDAGPTPAQAGQRALERVNAYRALAGLPPVTLDPGLSAACQAHADYLVRNAAVITRQKLPTNDEDASLPGATAAGKRAARQADVFSQAPEPVTQVDELIGTLLRRVFLLDPQLRRVGFGCGNDVGRGWQSVLDLSSGRAGATIVRYPAPDQEAVPCVGGERLPGSAAAPGFPISVTFPASARVLGGRGGLTDADGKSIETVLSSPEKPLIQSGSPRNTLCLYPRAPLHPGQTYTVTLSAVVDNVQWRQTWQFTTE